MAELRNRATLDIADFRRGVSLMLSDIDRVQKRVNLFSGNALTIPVNVNTTQATAKLAALQAAMNALSSTTINVGARGGLPTPAALPSPIPANGVAQAGAFNSSLTVVSSTVRSYTTVLGLVSPQLSGVSYWTLRLIDELGLFAGASNAAKLGLLGMVTVAGTLLTAIVALGKDGFNENKKLSDSFAILEANGVSSLGAVESKIRAIQGLSLTTQRKSITDYAEGLATLQRAGQTGADGLNILKNATILAANEGQNLNETSIQLTRNILQFGDDASQAGRYADVLTKASNDAIGSASDLSKGLNTVGTIAKFAGFSLEETTAALVELDNKGLSAADKGATALRNVLASVTSPTQQFRGAAKGLGVDLEDANGKIRSARDVVFDLIEALHKNNVTYDEATGKVTANAEAVAAASTLFRTRGFAAILSLTDQTLKLADSYKNASGAAEDYANILAKTPTGALERLGKAGENLALSFGKIITPALIAGATGLTGLFRSLEGVFNTIGDNKVLLFTLSTLGAGFVALKLSAGLSAASVVLFNNAIRLNVLGSVAAQGPLLAMSFGARTVAGSFTLATLATQGLATGFKTLTAALVANPITAIFVGLAVVAGVAANAVTRFYEDSTKASEASIAKSQEFVEKLKKVRAEASKLNNPQYTALKSREFIQQDAVNEILATPGADIGTKGRDLNNTRQELYKMEQQFSQQQKDSIGLTDEQSAAFDVLNEKILTLQTNFRSSGATDFEKDLQRVRKEIDDLVKSVNKDFGGNKGVLDSKLQQLQQLEQDLLSQSINKAVQAQADSRLEIEKSLAQARIALIQDGRQKANATLELELTDIKKNYAKRIDEAQKNLAAARRDGVATPAQIGSLETGLSALKRLQGEEETAARTKRNAEIVKLEQDVQDKIYGIEKTGADRRANLEAGGLDRIKNTVAKREEQRRIDLANANRTYDDLEHSAKENLKKTTDPKLVAEYNKELSRLAVDRTSAIKGIEGKAGDELISLRKAQIDQLLALQQTLAQSQLSNTQAGVNALEGNRDRALSGATTPQERAQIEAQSQAQILKLQQTAAQQSRQIAEESARTTLIKALENAKTLGASEGAARKTALETYQTTLQTAETTFNTARVNNTFASEKRIRDIRLEGLKAYLQGETESLNALTGLELETARKRLEAKLLVYRATGDREAVKAIEDALRGVNRQVNENSRTANKSLTDTKNTVLDLRAALEDAFGKSSPLEKAQDTAQKPFEAVAKGARDAAKALSEQLGKVNPSSALAGQLKAQIVALNQVQLEAQKGGQAARSSAELDFNTTELGKAQEFALKRAKTLYDSSPEVYQAGYQKELVAQQTFLETRLKDLKAGSAEYEQVQAALGTNRDTQKGLVDKQRQNAADLAGYKREELEASLALTTSDSQRQGVLTALVASSAEAVKSAQANVTALEAQKAPQAEILKAKRDLATASTKQLEDEKKLYQDAPGVTQAREQLDLKLKLARTDSERAILQAQILSSDSESLERAKSRVVQATLEGKPQEFVNGLIKERSALLEKVKGEQDGILEGVNRQADAELTLFKARQGLQAAKARSDAEVLQAQQDGIGYTLKEIANVDRLIAQGKAQGASEADLKTLTAQKLGLEGTLYGQINTARRAGLGIEGEKLSLLEAQSKTMLELSGLADDAVAVSQVDLRIAQAKLELAQKTLAEEKRTGTDGTVRKANEGVLGAQTDVSAKERAASAARFTATQELLDAQDKLNAAKLEEAGLSDNVLEKAKSQLQSDYERKAVLESQLSSGKLSIEGQRKAQDELNQLSGKIAGDERATGAASLTLIDEKLARESRIAQAKLAQLGLDDTALGNAKLQVAAQEAIVAALENKLQLGTLTPKEQADTTAALEEARGKLAGDRKAVTAEELVISGKVNAELEKRLGFQERLLNAGLKALGVDGNALVQAQAAVSLTEEKIKLLEKELAGQLSAQDRNEKTVQLEELRNVKTSEGRTLAHARFGEEERLLGVQEAQIAAQLEQAGLDANGITAARVRLGIEQIRLARMQAELASGTGTPAEQDALKLSIDKQRGVVAADTRAVSAAETGEVDKRLSLEERLLAAKVKQKGLSDSDLSVLQAAVIFEQRRTAELEKRLKDPKLTPDQKRELTIQLEEQKGKQAEKQRALEAGTNAEVEKNLGLLERQFQAKLKILNSGQTEKLNLEGTIALEQRRLANLQNQLTKATPNQRAGILTQIDESQAKIAENKRGLDKLAQADLERRLSLEDRVTAARILQAGLSSNDAAAQRIALGQEDARTKRIEDRLKNPALTSTEKDELRVQLEESRGKAVEKRLALRATENADLERQLSLSERLVAAEVQRSGQDSPLTAATAQVLTTQRAIAQLEGQLKQGGLSSTDQAEKRVKLSELSAKLAGDERGQRVALYGEAQRILETEKSQYELKLKQAGLDGNAIQTAQLERDYNKAALGLNAKQLAETNLTETERNKLLAERNTLLGESVDKERKVFDERYKQVALNLQGDKNRADTLLKLNFAGDDVAGAGLGLKSAQATLEVAKQQLEEGRKLKLNKEQIKALTEAEKTATDGVTLAQLELNKVLEAREILQRGLNNLFESLQNAGRGQYNALGEALTGLSIAQRNLGQASADAAPYLEKVARGEELTAEEALKARPAFDALTSSINAKRQALEAASKAYKEQAIAISGIQDAVATLNDQLNPGKGAGGKRTNERVNQRAEQALSDLNDALKKNDPVKLEQATTAFTSAFGTYQKLLEDNQAAAADVKSAQANLIEAQAGGEKKKIEEATKLLADAKKKFLDLGGDDVRKNFQLEQGAREALDILKGKLPKLELQRQEAEKQAKIAKERSEAAQLTISGNSVKIVDSLKLLIDKLSSEGLFKDLFKGVPEQAQASGFVAGLAFGKAFDKGRKIQQDLAGATAAFEAISDLLLVGNKGNEAGLYFADEFKAGTANIGSSIVDSLASSLDGATLAGSGAKAANDLLDGFDTRMNQATNSAATDKFVQNVTAKLSSIPAQAAQSASDASAAVAKNLANLENLKLKFPTLFSSLPNEAAKKGAEAGDAMGKALKASLEASLRSLDLGSIVANIKTQASAAVKSAADSVAARAADVPMVPPTPAGQNISRAVTYSDTYNLNLTLENPPNAPIDADLLARQIEPKLRDLREQRQRNTGECL